MAPLTTPPGARPGFCALVIARVVRRAAAASRAHLQAAARTLQHSLLPVRACGCREW
jgi:hypothetical protein